MGHAGEKAGFNLRQLVWADFKITLTLLSSCLSLTPRSANRGSLSAPSPTPPLDGIPVERLGWSQSYPCCPAASLGRPDRQTL